MRRSSCQSGWRARVAERPAQFLTWLPALVLAAALPACHCGDQATPFAAFTDLVYTRDGKALVLHGLDGIYVASPAEDTPRLVVDKTCEQSRTKSLDCVQASPDGRRVVVLADRRVVGSGHVWTLLDAQSAGAGLSYVTRTVDLEALDATLGPNGAELAFARTSEVEGAVDLFRAASDGPKPLVQALPLAGAAPVEAMRTVVVANSGVAYVRLQTEDVALWFQPWDGAGFQLGTLPTACAGVNLRYCVEVAADGTSLVWQEAKGGVIHAYRPDADVDLPLGQGYAFRYSPTGSFLLRLDTSPYTANVQNVESAVVARQVVGAAAALLSEDGETVAWLAEESRVLKTWRLSVGASRREGQDRDLGVWSEPTGRPLLPGSLGLAPLGFSLTGDGRFVILDAPPTPPASGAALVSVNAETGERRELAVVTCEGCCLVSPVGALVACLPTMSGGAIGAPGPLDLYDPVTGVRTRATEKAILLSPVGDGNAIAVMEYVGDVPELFVVYKDGRRVSQGLALRFAATPGKRRLAVLEATGRLSFKEVP